MMMKMKGMCAVHKAAWILVLIGALNWGLIGLFNFNLVMMLFGGVPMVERLVYILVGASAVAMLFADKCCMKKGVCACADEACTHCMAEDKKPMAGAAPMGGEKKM